jgi:magnesium transporter
LPAAPLNRQRILDPARIEHALERIRASLEAGEVQAAIDALRALHPADRAEAFSDLEDDEVAALLPELSPQTTARLLTELEDREAADLAVTLAPGRLADALDRMAPDEAADVLGDLDADRASEVLSEMEAAPGVLPLLPYPDNSAGGRMTTRFIAFPLTTAAAEAIDFLRKAEPGSDTPYYLYVQDPEGRLVGVVGVRDLLVADPGTPVQAFMKTDVSAVRTTDDQEAVARLMTRYGLGAIPVVDDQGVLRGVISHDDILDVIQQENTEDLYRLANIPSSDLSIESPIGISVRRRLPWLSLNALTALFAAWVIGNFQSLIAQVATLAVFQSVVASMGGNTGTQSLTLMVRAIALGQVGSRRARQMAIKEGLTGLLQGIVIGILVGAGVWLWKRNFALGAILAAALIGNMLVAGLVGVLVPVVLKSLRLDPALASSVIVTTFTDSIGFALFLGLGAAFVPYLQ